MENKRTAAFAFAVTALMLLTSVACVPHSKADALEDPSVGLYDDDGNFLEQAMLQDATFPINTGTYPDAVTGEVKIMALAGSVLPVEGAQLWVNGIGEDPETDVKVSMQVAFDPIGGEPNTTGDWLLQAGLKVILSLVSEHEAQIESEVSFVLEGAGDHESDVKEFDSITGAKYALKLELATDIEEELVEDLKNMRFTFWINNDNAVSITFNNAEEVLKVELVSDHVQGPSNDPKAEPGAKQNVFVGWNKTVTVDPKFAQWLDQMDISHVTTDLDLFAIFAERGDMNGDKVLNFVDIGYLLDYYNFIEEGYFEVKQDPRMIEGTHTALEHVGRLLDYYNFMEEGYFDLKPASPREEWDQ